MEQVKNVPKVIMPMQPWQGITFRKSFIAVFINFIFYQIFLVILIVLMLGILIIFGLIDNIGTIGVGLLTSIFLIVLVIDALLFISYYLTWTSFYYKIIPGSFKIVGDMANTQPATITVSQGVFNKHAEIHKITDYGDVVLNRSLFGLIFGYGTLTLDTSKDSTEHYPLTISNIDNPEKIMNIIQALLNDDAGTKMVNPDFKTMLGNSVPQEQENSPNSGS